MQKCITLEKEDPEGGALWDAQIHCGIKEKRSLTPVSTRFACLMHSFRSLLYNKPEIEYLYGTIPGIHYNIQVRRPSLVDWEFIQIIVTSMNRIIVSIFLNH